MISTASLSLVAVATAVSLASAQSLVPNGSFETAGDDGHPTGWTPNTVGTDTVTFARDAAAGRTGGASARLAIAGDTNPSWPAYECRMPVEPNDCYRLTAWIRTDSVEKVAYIAGDFLDRDGKRITFCAGGQVTGTTGDWVQATVRTRIPKRTVTMVVRLILHGNGTAWFDDVAVERDHAYERELAALAGPLPADWVARGTTHPGDPGRLRHLLSAAAKGGAYTVGIIGGSITAGAAASSRDMHYSAYVMEWLQATFPKAEWELVNAGIGATGSDYGCLRADRDLLSHRPDLVVTEYAVNDGNTRERAETYEGLLRQILTSPEKPAVLMLFMMNQAGGNAQEWQAKLGRHYRLPMLSYRDMCRPEIEAGTMTWQDVSPDEVHPNDRGHGYTGKLLVSMLERARAADRTDTKTPETPEPLPAALLSGRFASTRLLEAADLTPVAHDGWSFHAAPHGRDAWVSSTPGSVLEFEVTGQTLFVGYWRLRGPMGRARITIDGTAPTVQEAWFPGTWGGYRNLVRLEADTPGKHRVRIELLAEKHAESTGTEFRLMTIGSAGQ